MVIWLTVTWAWLLVALAIVCLVFGILLAAAMWRQWRDGYRHTLAMEAASGLLFCALLGGAVFLLGAGLVDGWLR